MNSLINVLPFREACGAKAGTVRVPIVDPRIAQNFGGFSIRNDEKEGDDVALVRLDDHDIPRCRLLTPPPLCSMLSE